MSYKAFFAAKPDQDRNFDIKYAVFEDDGSYYIESFVEGGKFSEKVFLGNCGEEKSKKLAALFAEKGVHPLHIEDIISDMRF